MENKKPPIDATHCQQIAFDCLHGKASLTEINIQGLWKKVLEEINALSDHEDYGQADVPLHLSQRILQDEAEYLGFPVVASSADLMSIDVADKGACAALSKLCEMFVLEMTHRSYHLRNNRSGALRKEDVLRAIKSTEIYDLFLDHLNDL